jgi:hypothetical protein
MCTARRTADVGNGNDRTAAFLPAVPHGKKASARLFPPRTRKERLTEHLRFRAAGFKKLPENFWRISFKNVAGIASAVRHIFIQLAFASPGLDSRPWGPLRRSLFIEPDAASMLRVALLVVLSGLAHPALLDALKDARSALTQFIRRNAPRSTLAAA